jgi:hypothetical protein
VELGWNPCHGVEVWTYRRNQNISSLHQLPCPTRCIRARENSRPTDLLGPLIDGANVDIAENVVLSGADRRVPRLDAFDQIADS